MKRKFSILFFLKYLIITLALIIILAPITFIFVNSFRLSKDIIINPLPFSSLSLTLHNYMVILFDPTSKIIKGLINSLVVVPLSVILVSFIALFTGYGLLRFHFNRIIKGIMLGIILITRILPSVSAAVPYFVIAKTFNLYDSYLILITVYFTKNLPFAIFMMMSFFEEVPKEIEEAASIDGASFLRMFFKVIIPLTLPGLFATAVFVFIFCWNEYLFAFFLTQEKAVTLPIAVSWYIGEFAIEWGELNASAVISTVPVIILTLSIQKYLIRGLTLGAIKG
ncbi:MAG: carbohydrate ABC transporter permease [Nitrososphaeria archaeon]